MQIIAALLTIIGYSLNDTIVIFDRIRENMRAQRRNSLPLWSIERESDAQSHPPHDGLHPLVVLAIFLLGGEVLHDFAFALFVGMIAETYSTVFIASPSWSIATRGRLHGRKTPVRAVMQGRPENAWLVSHPQPCGSAGACLAARGSSSSLNDLGGTVDVYGGKENHHQSPTHDRSARECRTLALS